MPDLVSIRRHDCRFRQREKGGKCKQRNENKNEKKTGHEIAAD
jgi:hypothetical protein